jgi:hypothetical protein
MKIKGNSMKNTTALRTLLVISGLILIGVGGAILFMPVVFYAANGIDLGGNFSLLNEIRPPGGALLASGVVIISGAFILQLTFTSLVLSILIYLSYGLSRILSMALDGIPDGTLVMATGLEMILGLMGVLALIRCREKEVGPS